MRVNMQSSEASQEVTSWLNLTGYERNAGATFTDVVRSCFINAEIITNYTINIASSIDRDDSFRTSAATNSAFRCFDRPSRRHRY